MEALEPDLFATPVRQQCGSSRYYCGSTLAYRSAWYITRVKTIPRFVCSTGRWKPFSVEIPENGKPGDFEAEAMSFGSSNIIVEQLILRSHSFLLKHV